MTKKILSVICCMIFSVWVWAKPSLLISVSAAESMGYMRFLTTSSILNHQEAELRIGMTVNKDWSAYASAGIDFYDELKSYTKFASLGSGTATSFGVGTTYKRGVFALNLDAGIRIMDISDDMYRKYAMLIFRALPEVSMFSTVHFDIAIAVPVSMSFSGCGCDCDFGVGTSFKYRVDLGGGK